MRFRIIVVFLMLTAISVGILINHKAYGVVENKKVATKPVVPNAQTSFEDQVELKIETIVSYVRFKEIESITNYIKALEIESVIEYFNSRVISERHNYPASTGQSQTVYNSNSGDFLSCVRNRESGGNYGIYNSGGSGAAGAYQFLPGTWNSVAASIGRYDLVGVSPANASPADQDMMAQALYSQQGSAPWGGSCG